MQPIDNYDAVFEQTQMAGAVGQQAQASAAAQYYLEEQQKNLAETQLEVESITERVYHLLKQDFLKPLDDGRIDWQPITDQKKRTLTDWGVDRIMQVVHFYLNKNTLLSCFDEPQINRIMLRFCNELNDLVLLKYEVLFRRPTFEECKEILLERIDEQRKLKMFSAEIIGVRLDPAAVKEQLLKEAEKKIEYELKKIREEQIKEKLKEYGLLMAQLEAMVYATYNRAYRGEERGSIRRHTNISEVIGNRPMGQKESGGMFKWLKG